MLRYNVLNLASSVANATLTDDNTSDLNGTMEGDETSDPADPYELATLPLYESLQSFIGDSEGSFAGSSVDITPSGEFIAVGSRKADSPSGKRLFCSCMFVVISTHTFKSPQIAFS